MMMKPMMDPNPLSKLMEENPLLKAMDQNAMLKQASEFQRTAIDTSFNAMEVMQGRMEKVMRMFWDQTAWNSERLGGVFQDWTKSYQDGCDAVRLTMENQMGRLGCVLKPMDE